MRSFSAVLEDLLPMKHVMKLCQETNNSDFIYANKKEGLKYEQLKFILKNISKNRKRECAYTFNE